jgi:hypothetical protein
MSTSPACGICAAHHFEASNGSCQPCSAASTAARTGALVTLIVFLLMIYGLYRLCRKRIRRLKHKAEDAATQYADVLELALEYGADGMKIFVVFWQISSTSPGLLDLPFPPVYTNFLALFKWVNFDVLGLLGLDCVGNLDYRARVALSCMLPVLIVGCSVLVYATKKIKTMSQDVRTASQKEREEAVLALFDLVDADKSGYVEPHEFKMMLRELNHKRLDMKHVEHMMKRIMGLDNNAPAAAEQIVRLSRQQFMDAAMSGNIADTNVDKWVKYIQENRQRSQIFSTAFQLLGLIHAPVSSKLFHYFDCHPMGTRSFLVSVVGWLGVCGCQGVDLCLYTNVLYFCSGKTIRCSAARLNTQTFYRLSYCF